MDGEDGQVFLKEMREHLTQFRLALGRVKRKIQRATLSEGEAQPAEAPKLVPRAWIMKLFHVSLSTLDRYDKERPNNQYGVTWQGVAGRGRKNACLYDVANVKEFLHDKSKRSNNPRRSFGEVMPETEGGEGLGITVRKRL